MYLCFMTRSAIDSSCVTMKAATGITLHESSDWDELSSNKGSGNILELMDLPHQNQFPQHTLRGLALLLKEITFSSPKTEMLLTGRH